MGIVVRTLQAVLPQDAIPTNGARTVSRSGPAGIGSPATTFLEPQSRDGKGAAGGGRGGPPGGRDCGLPAADGIDDGVEPSDGDVAPTIDRAVVNNGLAHNRIVNGAPLSAEATLRLAANPDFRAPAASGASGRQGGDFPSPARGPHQLRRAVWSFARNFTP